MEASLKNSGVDENTLIWAIICSILLHVLLAVVVPNFKFDITEEVPKELTIEIQKPTPPQPIAIPEPPQPIEPPKPEPIKKIIEPKPKPIAKPIEKPSPIEEPQTAPPPPAPSDVIAVAPKADTTPTVTVPAPVETPKPVEHSPVDVDNALDEYGSLLGRAIAKHKQYPRIAQMRGWQGEVLLDLKLDGNGRVLSASVRESSGFDAFDKQALEMVHKAAPFPLPPEPLRNRTFNITVPVSFKLENP